MPEAFVQLLIFSESSSWEDSDSCLFVDSRFKLKYHPEESSKRRAEQKGMLMRRVEVFLDFLERKKIDQV